MLIGNTAKVITTSREGISTKLETATHTVTFTTISTEKITEKAILTMTTTIFEAVIPEYIMFTLFGLIIIVIILSAAMAYIIERKIKNR